jgi:KDO2-lipid IV(A) lauroyltransferase
MSVNPKSGSGLASATPRVVVRALVALARIAPTVKFYASGWFWGNLFYLLSRRYRRLVARNLDLAYGDELSKGQKRRIARASFVGFVQEALLLLKYVHLKSWQVEKVVEIENEDRLKDALSRGRGVALVTGHLSNFPLAITRLVRVGYRVGVLRRKVKGRTGEELFGQLMSMVGVRTFYHKGTLLPLGRFLRDGGAVLFTIDQNARRGVQVPFFGVPAATFTAPVRFALSMNAVVLPIFIHREKRGRYVLTIEEPIELIREKSDQALHDNLLKLSLVLEKYVRMYPEQWFWLHRRWRHVKGKPS